MTAAEFYEYNEFAPMAEAEGAQLAIVKDSEAEKLSASDIEYAMQIAFLLGHGVVLHEAVNSDHDARMKRMQEIIAPQKGHSVAELNINDR